MSYLIKNKDAIKFIKELKSQNEKPFIDCVLTDPPYNISRENNFKTIGRNGIDFGEWDYKFNQTLWIEEVAPLVKSGGSIIIFNDYKNMGEICKTLEKNGFVIKDLLRWIKKNPMPRNMQRRYVTDYELALWATKKKAKWTFNKPKSEIYLRPRFEHSIVSNGKNKIHPTQKPIKLLNDLITRHTNAGDIIFDPFMGSGSTGVATIDLKRVFIGSEISKKYYQKAASWITQTYTRSIKNKKINRSPLYYLGDKYKLLPQIYNYFPSEIDCFYDLFGGGGTVTASIVANKYFYNDIDPNAVKLVEYFKKNDFAKIITKVRAIIKKFNLSYQTKKLAKETNKASYLKLRTYYNNLSSSDSFEKLSHLLILVIYGFNSQIRFNGNGVFNIPCGKQDLNKSREIILKTFINILKTKNVCFSNKSFLEFAKKKFNGKDFIYLDPPYSITNATYNKNWSASDDKKLFKFLDDLNARKIKWAMSNVLESGNKVNKKLIAWSSNYYCHHLDFNYNNSNYQKKENGAREVLITNYYVK